MKPEIYDNYEFKHIHPIQIRFDDVDAMGHVNNTVLMSYFDYGKWKYIEELNSKLTTAEKMIPVIVHYEVDFFESIFINEKIYVQTKIIGFGTKSLQMVQSLVSESKKVKCVCKTIMSGFDKDKNLALVISDAFKKASEEMESI